MRLAWFSPWPPQTSGIAVSSAEAVPSLAGRGHGIDVFVDARCTPVLPAGPEAPSAGEIRVQSAHDFVWRAGRRQYDLVVYQAGNSRLHEYLWPYLFRYPGLTVLHDARLHHARASARLFRHDVAGYREEFTWNQPAVPAAAAELAVAGFDGSYYYLWPMTRGVTAASRMVACHARGAVDAIAAESPGTPVAYLALGHGRQTPVSADVRSHRRAALGLASSDVAFGLFGALTADKRVPQVLAAFRTLWRHLPHVRLVLAGARGPRLDVLALLRSLGLERGVRLLDAPDAETFDELIAAVDVALCLRWPTALETSGPWLRALSAGTSTVTVDLAHQTHVPALDPRSWSVRPPSEPVTVAVDILDEAHSLGLAMSRLAVDGELRARLARAGRAYWEREHSLERMTEDYERILPLAVSAPMPEVRLPSGLRPDPLAYVQRVLDGFGDPGCVLR
jgi:glycosyltransferase involved in cell wall biosynthesis